jgi:hypothetical protein
MEYEAQQFLLLPDNVGRAEASLRPNSTCNRLRGEACYQECCLHTARGAQAAVHVAGCGV